MKPILLEQAFGVTQPTTKPLNVLARFKSMNLFVEGTNRLQATQSSGSRSHRPPPFGASKLNVMYSIKPKVEPGSSMSTSQKLFKSSSSLHLGKMLMLCSLESISKVSEMLVSKQVCIETLK